MPKQTTPQLREHYEQIARALRDRADRKNDLSYQANICVRRYVTKLANLTGTRRLVKHSATFTRAVVEIERRGRESFRASEQRVIDGTCAALARWLEIADWTPPAKPPKPTKEQLPPLKRHKAMRRFKVNGNWLEGYGVEMNDRLLIAMTGEVRPGELGYFEVYKTHGSYNSFFFVYECDETCRQWEGVGGGICLRTYADRCNADHTEGSKYIKGASAFGRVVGVERDRMPIETTLPIRPYDERERGPTTKLTSGHEPEDFTTCVYAPDSPASRIKNPQTRETLIPAEAVAGVDEFLSIEMPDKHEGCPEGTRPGDTFLIYRTDDLRRDDLAAFVTKDGTWFVRRLVWNHAGRFRYVRVPADGGRGKYRTAGQGAELYGRAVHLVRGGEVVEKYRPMRDTAGRTTEVPPRRKKEDERVKKIRELGGRLEELSEQDDWESYCGGQRFRLEKQIYDLERDIERDDWPEYLDG